MKNTVLLSIISILLVAGTVFAGDWETLFDGKSLDNWENPYEWGEAEVVDGEIHLTASKKFFLCTKKKYSNFIFEAELKMPEGKSNSGIMFRANKEKNKVWGYQAEADPSERAWSGGLYGEKAGGWKYFPRKPADGPSGQAFRTATKDSFKLLDWNKYRIHCDGNRIRIYLNDVLCTDYIDNDSAEGYIGLQHHGEEGQVYKFRNIRIKELDDSECEQVEREVVMELDFEKKGMECWEPTDAAAWQVDPIDGSKAMHLHAASNYKPPARSPRSINVLKDIKVGSFILDAVVKSTGQDVPHLDTCFFFGYQDPTHFYYTHIAQRADKNAHTIMVVDDGPRTPIVKERTDGIKWGKDWHRVRVIRDVDAGLIEVYWDDLSKPVMTAEDKRFGEGRIGIGSFDDTAYYDDIRIIGLTKK